MIDHYTVTLKWEPLDQCFVARVAELPGCTADGRTRRESVKAIAFSIREWIAAVRSLGEAVPNAAEHQATLTLREVSATSGLPAATIRQHIAHGELQAVRAGQEWRISPSAYADFERARFSDRRQAPLKSSTAGGRKAKRSAK